MKNEMTPYSDQEPGAYRVDDLEDEHFGFFRGVAYAFLGTAAGIGIVTVIVLIWGYLK